VAATTPVLVTLRCKKEVGRLRRRIGYLAVRDALEVSARRADRFRIVHVSIQRSELHLLVEAADKRELAHGLQSFSISCARQLNRHLGRSGGVFADRYRAQVLTTPKEVRQALSYVLNNWRRHGENEGGKRGPWDPYSSARAFDGWTTAWRGRIAVRSKPLPTSPAQTWLLTSGWRRHRLISPTETPRAVYEPM
jgi:REP element-mobilizing transposase RayT